ncbi:MAG: ribosomal protein S18-alanine N-acetyltransferase, partial [Archangium sp.]|nr:ribosomal protein S18-alanine N-acetyltransferase [Archangium sp.]
DWSTVLLAEALDGAAWVLRGFVIDWLVVDEVHVLNVATDTTFRRQGVARRVLTAVLETGRAQRCRLATLEVRASNTAAKALYASLGFQPVGLRRAYYSDNKEDAVVMTLEL